MIHQIESEVDKALEEKYRHQANLAVKDSYNFDFLELGQEYDEKKLELGLINNVRSFLLEMGGSFSFIGNHTSWMWTAILFYDMIKIYQSPTSLVSRSI